jgi:hypothetical protein
LCNLYSHQRTFGCVVHVKVTKLNLKKLDDRSRPMIFVGYESGSAAYRCYDPNTKCVHISRDVIFDEKVVWNWSMEQAAEMNFEFTVDGETKIPESTEASPVVVEVTVPSVINVGGGGGYSGGVPEGGHRKDLLVHQHRISVCQIMGGVQHQTLRLSLKSHSGINWMHYMMLMHH